MGNKKFPSSLKEAGWQNAQALLDKEFPVAAAKGGFIAGKLIIVAMALLIIPAAIWYLNSPTVLPAEGDSVPNEQIEPALENNDLNSVVNTESENKSLQKTEGNEKEKVDENSNFENSNIVSNEETDGVNNQIAPQIPSNDDNSRMENGDQSQPEMTEEKMEPNNVTSRSEDHPAQDSKGTDSGKPGIMENPGGIDENSGFQEEDGSDVEDEVEDIDSGIGNDKKLEDNPKKENETPIAKSEVDPEISEVEENVEERDTSNIPDPNEANLLSTKKQSRKEHFAFLDIPSIPDDADYQLFSRERFSISMWGGYSYIDKFLNGDSQSYLDKREKEEDAIWTASSGFKIDYFLDNRWTFGFGLGYAEYGENLKYNLNQRDTTKIDGRNSSPSSFSNIVELDSTRIVTGINQGHWNYTIVTENGDSSVLGNNGKTSWQYLEIPFTVGYRFGNSRIKRIDAFKE